MQYTYVLLNYTTDICVILLNNVTNKFNKNILVY